MKFLAPLFTVLLLATNAVAVPPDPPTFFAQLETCAYDRRGVSYEVYPQDDTDIVKQRVYRNGGLHMDRQWLPLGINRLKWWHIPEEYEGLTFVYYATVVNSLNEESFPSVLQFVEITPCPEIPVIADLFVSAVDCENVHLAWTQATSEAKAYRINRVPESELWLYLTDSKRQRIAVSTESLSFMEGPPPPYYDDPPTGWGYPWESGLWWGDQYFPLVPEETFCYWVESWIPYSLSDKSDAVCVTIPACP